MTNQEFKAFISTSPADRKKIIEKLVSPKTNPRQEHIDINKAYYNGEHWDLSADGTSNTTKSGKKVWGKLVRENNIKSQDPYQRDNNNGFDPSFHKGQLQIRNYIKQFIHIYQDYLFGNSSEPFQIKVAEPQVEGEQPVVANTKEINQMLETFWFENSDVLSISKSALAQAILTTVFNLKLKYSTVKDDYIVEACDSSHLFPIYDGEEVVGYMIAYTIDANTAKMYGVDTNDEAYFTKVFYDQGDGVFMNTLVNGEIISEVEDGYTTVISFDDAAIKLDDRIAFLPYFMQPNIDSATSKFDDYTLEDSEIFGWIDKNDALNANETMAFLGTILYVFPKTVFDYEKAEKAGMDPDDPAIKQGAINWTPSMFQLDNMPVKTEPGQKIDESFYNQLDRIKTSLFEEASIPEFLLNGKGLSQISEQTVKLAMASLIKKIEQKRDALTKLYKEVSVKYLSLKGIELPESEIIVQWGDITLESKSQIATTLQSAVTAGILPASYVQRKILELTNNEEDIAEVKELAQAEISGIRSAVEERRREIQNQRQAEQALAEDTRTQEALAETEARIQTLQN